MNKLLAITVLLVSTSISAHGPFQSGFFSNGFNNGFWRDFDRQFQQLDHEINRLKHTANSVSSQSRRYFDKDNNSYVLEIKTPGLDKNKLEISTNQNRLLIKGVHRSKKTSANQSFRSSSSFSHSLSIPRDGDKDNISTDFKDGVLKVSIPKLNKPRLKVKVQK
jgi:HSP20 family protein